MLSWPADSKFAADPLPKGHTKSGGWNTLALKAMTTTPNSSPNSPRPALPGLAVLLTLVIGITAAAIVSVFCWKRDPATPTGSIAVSQSVSPPPNPLDRDGRFLFLLEAQGLQLSGGRDASINDAHAVCSRVAAGESEAQIVKDIVRGSPGMSPDTAADFADTAITVYCPHGSETP
ncbi:hypothetical protein MBOT_02460 [Mycobacterium botniense]|uniref:DUF732 domain-containing protein n=2 Tax=Mycobacterium botniense TaxID=84962 RepID=A0A7I9XSB0_9MYCO|nr:hypothetical protein MBOT_02460 [Mycobacterium botniense]